MSTATKVIRQIAAGQVSGQGLRKKADEVVASSTATTCRAHPAADQTRFPGNTTPNKP